MLEQKHTHWISASGRQGASGDREALFPYWSFTKTVIALCAMKMAEAGQIDMDAPLGKAPHSLRHLLRHNAGIPDYGSLKEYHTAVEAEENAWPVSELLEKVMRKYPLFPVGEGWAYSNVGYLLARHHLQNAADMTLDQIVATHVTGPMGLPSIRLASSLNDMTAVHWPLLANYDPGWVYHGCLIGNAEDAARLLHNVMIGTFLTRQQREAMLDALDVGGEIPGRPWTKCGYGIGLMSGDMGNVGRAMGHSGGGPHASNAVYHFPDLRDPITAACFTSGSDESAAEQKIAEIAQHEQLV